MNKCTIIIVFLCIICSFGPGKTIIADVTNDGVDDIIKMGLKIVTVQDGVSNKLHTIVAGVESLADISVDDYFSMTKGNEIAVLMLPERSFLTEVYGYRNKRFVKVSEILPGELSFDEERRLFGYAVHAWDHNEVMTYWPIIEDEGYMKAAPIAQSAETTVVVAAKETKEMTVVLQGGTFTMCVAATSDTNVIVFLMDEDGTLIKQTTISPRTGFYGRVIAKQAKTITFAVDNSQSAESKTIHVITIQYRYP